MCTLSESMSVYKSKPAFNDYGTLSHLRCSFYQYFDGNIALVNMGLTYLLSFEQLSALICKYRKSQLTSNTTLKINFNYCQ